MKKVIRISEDNIYIEDVILQANEKTPVDCVELTPPDGLYRAKWTGQEWVENATQEYIDSLKQPISVEPTLEQKVEKHEVELATLSETIEAIFGGV